MVDVSELMALSDALDASESAGPSPSHSFLGSSQASAAASNTSVPWNPRVAKLVLREHFGFDSFRDY